MKKYQVEWHNHTSDTKNKHGVFNTWQEAMDSIYSWWEQNGFEPRTVRYWTVNNITTIDYGYHYLFYKVVEIESNQLIETE